MFKECLLNVLSEITESNTEEQIKQALNNVKKNLFYAFDLFEKREFPNLTTTNHENNFL